jgi:hypothetical protein
MADSLGNAFHRLRAYAHPHVKHVITQTLQQNDEADFEPKLLVEFTAAFAENQEAKAGNEFPNHHASPRSSTTGIRFLLSSVKGWHIFADRGRFRVSEKDKSGRTGTFAIWVRPKVPVPSVD